MKSTHDERWAWILLALFLALGLAIALVLLLEEAPDAAGRAHALHPGLAQGGPAAARHADLLIPGAAIAALELLAMVALLAFGYRREERLGPLARPLLAAALVNLAALLAVFFAYGGQMGDAQPALWLALPAPTALLLYVFWPAQALFVVVFVRAFARWYWRPEDERRFQALLERHREREEPS